MCAWCVHAASLFECVCLFGVADNDVGDEGAKAIGSSLVHVPGLTELGLGGE